MASLEGQHIQGRHRKVKIATCRKCHPELPERVEEPVEEEAPAVVAEPVKAPRKPRSLTQAIAEAPEPITPEVSDVIAEFVAYQPGTSREDWLMRAVDLLRPRFAAAGFPVPDRVRVSVGWPGGRGKKSGVIGQCWPTEVAGDALHHIFISPVLTNPIEVLDTLEHELIHASVEKGSKHRGPFARLAKQLGHVAPWTNAAASPETRDIFAGLAGELGEYDHGGLTSLGRQAVQTTRMLKVTCPECGCVIRMTRMWLDKAGAPTCACGTEMEEAS